MNDELRLSELFDVLSPEELEAIARRPIDTNAYSGSLLIPSGRPDYGMRRIPPNDRGLPMIYPDREAPPQKGSIYQRPKR